MRPWNILARVLSMQHWAPWTESEAFLSETYKFLGCGNSNMQKKMFMPIWGNDSIWLVCFRGAELENNDEPDTSKQSLEFWWLAAKGRSAKWRLFFSENYNSAFFLVFSGNTWNSGACLVCWDWRYEWKKILCPYVLSFRYDSNTGALPHRVENKRDSWIVSDISPSLKLRWHRHSTCKWMVGSWDFLFGWPIFQMNPCKWWGKRYLSTGAGFLPSTAMSVPGSVVFLWHSAGVGRLLWDMNVWPHHHAWCLVHFMVFTPQKLQWQWKNTTIWRCISLSKGFRDFRGCIFPTFGNDEFVLSEAGKVEKVPVAFWGRVLTNKVERAWFEKCYYEAFWGVWWLLLWTRN